jgi:hypothetical protein
MFEESGRRWLDEYLKTQIIKLYRKWTDCPKSNFIELKEVNEAAHENGQRHRQLS